MRGLNKAQIIGNLGQDPELRYTGSGTAVCNLSVATNDPRRDEAEWHSVTAWGELGELCNKHLEKGRRVYVEGEMRTRTFEDSNGISRRRTEVHADEVIFLGAEGSPDRDTDGRRPQQEASPETDGEQFEPDDEMPF